MKHLKLIPVSFLIIVIITGQAIAQVKKVDGVGITVRDMDRSIRFYTEVLGFTMLSDRELSGEATESLMGKFGIRIRVVEMQLGEEKIELVDYLTSGGRSIPEDTRSNDLSFQHIAIVVSDMDRAFEQLRRHQVEFVSTAPQTLPLSNLAAAGIKAFYFHDPDRHNLELIYFPKGKGQPKWQRSSDGLFLGIDHTAIGISSTEKSLRFYQALLGLDRKGDSWNMGSEQAHLNNIEGASLHITGLRAGEGPGVEFLEYLQPGPGKPYPADSQPDDLWTWYTTVSVDNAAKIYEEVKKAGYTIASNQLVSSSAGPMAKAFLARDPDGHLVLVKEKNSNAVSVK